MPGDAGANVPPITPIFVVGMNRSGTKWLSNILSNHPDVAAIRSPEAYGILETNIFHALRHKFPDLSRPDEFVALIELWSATDFFRIAGATKQSFYELRPRPISHCSLFELLMNDFTVRSGKKYWLQKVDPLHLFEIARHFENARYVVIERHIHDVLRSTFYSETGGNGSLPVRRILSHVHQRKILRRFRATVRSEFVTYESLVRNPGKEIGRICSALQIQFIPSMLENRFVANTSFATKDSRSFRFSASDRAKIKLFSIAGELMPYPLLHLARHMVMETSVQLTPGTFETIKRERDVR